MSARKHKAFTMVEMLVVILLIAILVTIIIGVSKKVSGTRATERTRLTMAVVMDAIDALTNVDPDHKAPPEWWTIPGPEYYPLRPVALPVPDINSGRPSTVSGPDWQAYSRCGFLCWELTLTAQSKAKMPTASEAYALPAGSPNFCKTQYNPTYEDRRAFADGYGKYMDYQQASGAGGTPLLISAGPDGKFGTEDDIRSDRR